MSLGDLKQLKTIRAASEHSLRRLANADTGWSKNITPCLETSKSGCQPADLADLAARVAAEPGLRLRGLMAIPKPHPDPERRRPAFRRMKQLFDDLRADYPTMDTLSMGMSDDFPLAIAEGATLVRIGTALFGPRV